MISVEYLCLYFYFLNIILFKDPVEEHKHFNEFEMGNPSIV